MDRSDKPLSFWLSWFAWLFRCTSSFIQRSRAARTPCPRTSLFTILNDWFIRHNLFPPH
nr:MAG TPA: hypothetical protein [Caudoviricetes sp.]